MIQPQAKTVYVEEIFVFYLHFPALSKTSPKSPLSTSREELIIAQPTGDQRSCRDAIIFQLGSWHQLCVAP